MSLIILIVVLPSSVIVLSVRIVSQFKIVLGFHLECNALLNFVGIYLDWWFISNCFMPLEYVFKIVLNIGYRIRSISSNSSSRVVSWYSSMCRSYNATHLSPLRKSVLLISEFINIVIIYISNYIVYCKMIWTSCSEIYFTWLSDILLGCSYLCK